MGSAWNATHRERTALMGAFNALLDRLGKTVRTMNPQDEGRGQLGAVLATLKGVHDTAVAAIGSIEDL